MPKLGQHFLKNSGACALISRCLEIKEGDVVVEIGPGHGELTSYLLAPANSEARHGRQNSRLIAFKVIAIERDAKLVEFLKKRFSGDARIEIVEGDVLKNLVQLVSALPSAEYKVVGNIPYYITGKVLRTIGEL